MSSNLSEAPVSAPTDTERTHSNRTLRYWLWTWLPVAAGIVIICVESTRAMGSDNTNHPLRVLYETIFGKVSSQRWDVIHLYIRKSGHFFGYGLIGITWLRAFWRSLPNLRFSTDVKLALLFTFLIAGSDELHQSFLPNRTSSIRDVMLDCTGSLILQCCVYVFLRIFQPGQLQRAA